MERTPVDRRSPDRHVFVLRLLRRIATVSLLLAALVWAIPRILVARGVLGPDAGETIQTAAAALQGAEAYGATDTFPEVQAARAELQAARAHLDGGREREAREAAARATASAIEAQRRALMQGAVTRDRARAVYEEIDRQVVELDKLYDAATEGLSREETARLFSMMKTTRVATGAVFLAYEEENHARVLRAEAAARSAIADARRQLEAAKNR